MNIRIYLNDRGSNRLLISSQFQGILSYLKEREREA